MIRRLLTITTPDDPWGPLPAPVDPWAGHPLLPDWMPARDRLAAERHHPVDVRSHRRIR